MNRALALLVAVTCVAVLGAVGYFFWEKSAGWTWPEPVPVQRIATAGECRTLLMIYRVDKDRPRESFDRDGARQSLLLCRSDRLITDEDLRMAGDD